MSREDARRALAELYRIVKPGGPVVFSLDFPDEAYEREPHEKSGEGDLIYTGGKWAGMVFHPYTYEEIAEILPVGWKGSSDSMAKSPLSAAAD